MNRIELNVENLTDEIRIDKWISENYSELSRAAVQKLIKEGSVTLNKKTISKSCSVKNDDLIEIILPEPTLLDVKAENLPVEIVYQDDDLLVVNKPKGMVVHPAPGNYSGTLVNALLYHCEGKLSSINGVIRPGIVHRIDKDTSGLLIVAKNDKSHAFLAEQIKEHSFTREYQAVVFGKFAEKTGEIDEPIGRHPVQRKKMSVRYENSKPAITKYEVLEEYSGYSLVKLNLFTGRTHQIRVHMSHIGHHVFGDEAYGRGEKGCKGQCLHAKKIGFIHPTTNEYMEFDSELPEYFKNVLNKLKK